MRRTRGISKIDETDRQLCQLLGADPRTSNRSLAATIGITDETVAARLRHLREHGILATTISIDWKAAGFSVQAAVRVHAAGRPFRDVVRPLVHHRSTLAITETSGCCDGVVLVLACSLAELRSYVATELRPLPGVARVVVDILVDSLKLPDTIATLPIPQWDPDDLPEPSVLLDDLDRQLLRELTRDGHESNSEIARRLGVSDATIRRRVQRLEDSGLVQVVAAFDPVATGDLTAAAYVFADVVDVDDFAAALSAEQLAIWAYSCVGSCGALAVLGSSTDGEVTAYASDTLPRLASVVATGVAYMNEVLHHQSHLVRLRPR